MHTTAVARGLRDAGSPRADAAVVVNSSPSQEQSGIPLWHLSLQLFDFLIYNNNYYY